MTRVATATGAELNLVVSDGAPRRAKTLSGLGGDVANGRFVISDGNLPTWVGTRSPSWSVV
ncbi:hypothetical protein GCM10027290_06790 [Micromonospora sonneratiae]